jgi:hypothetical protein
MHRFNKQSFLFTIDFKRLYTNNPVEDAIKCIIELVNEYQDVIPCANFIIKLLEIILQNSLMSFDGEYFQQFFGVNMGTNVAPILDDI